MKLTEKEIETCLLYILKPFLKSYDIDLQALSLKIDESIIGNATIGYQGQSFDTNFTFDLSYQDHCICFFNIDGKVEYLFLKLDLFHLLQQCIKDKNVIFKESSILYQCHLPIQSIELCYQGLDIILNDRSE